MAEINGISVPFVPVIGNEAPVKAKLRDVNADFGSIFKEELEKVKFSNHALKRLESRNIHLNEDQMNKIQTAVEKAESKGARDSLVMMDNTALIVNIPNKTVVTALPIGEGNDNVFTNIDSVVFA
jgi:flagellar operon protein